MEDAAPQTAHAAADDLTLTGNLSDSNLAAHSTLDPDPFTPSREDDALENADDGDDAEEAPVPVDTLQKLESKARDMQARHMQDARRRLEQEQQFKAAAVEQLARNYALKLDVVKQVEDFEISRREFYDQKRESNAMYWMAFTLIMKRARGENTRYLDFFSRKLAAEATYVRCLVEIKEESDKLKHGGEKKSALEVAFGAPRKNLLDDLLGVQEQVAEKCHAFQRVIEAEIVPSIEGMMARFNASMDQILKDGEEFLEDMELAEANAQSAYRDYREQAELLEKSGSTEQDLWINEMRYRVAVTVLHETWAICSKGLGDLFTHMKQMELTRRTAIHTALQTLHDQQGLYWRKLPEIASSVSALVATKVVSDPQAIEKEIGADIRTGAHRLEISEEGRRRKAQITANRPSRIFSMAPSAAGSSAASTTDAAVPEPPPGNTSPPPPAEGSAASSSSSSSSGSAAKKKKAQKEFALNIAGPLDSPLTRHSQVLLRKSTNVFKPWKPVLAVLTVDNFLHLFDIPQSSATAGIALGSSTQEAMNALLPRPDSVNKASGLPVSPRTLVGREKDSNKKTLSQLSPSHSLNLAHCEAHFKPPGTTVGASKEPSFEVVEQVTSTGIKKVFKDMSQRRIALRGATKEDMGEWVQLIQNAASASSTTASSHGGK